MVLLLLLACAGSAGAQPAERPDPAARLPRGGAASEYWDLHAEFDDGHRLFARFMITNAGPGDRSAVAVGTLHTPDGEERRFHNARREGRWQLSEDRLRLDVGNSHLDLHGPERRYEITKKSLRLELRFQGDSGLSVPTGLLPDGYSIDLIEQTAAASGWYQGAGDTDRVPLAGGRLALVHTVSNKEEAKQVRRRVEYFDLSHSAPVYLLDWISPKGKSESWISFGNSADGTSDSSDPSKLRVVMKGTATGWKNRKYWVPESMELSRSSLVGAIAIGPILQEEDSLGDLPQPFRWVLGLRMRPRRVWAGGNFGVTLLPSPETAPRIQQGNGLVIMSFLDELPRESIRAPK